jgi:hypothetical protein
MQNCAGQDETESSRRGAGNDQEMVGGPRCGVAPRGGPREIWTSNTVMSTVVTGTKAALEARTSLTGATAISVENTAVR